MKDQLKNKKIDIRQLNQGVNNLSLIKKKWSEIDHQVHQKSLKIEFDFILKFLKKV